MIGAQPKRPPGGRIGSLKLHLSICLQAHAPLGRQGDQVGIENLSVAVEVGGVSPRDRLAQEIAGGPSSATHLSWRCCSLEHLERRRLQLGPIL